MKKAATILIVDDDPGIRKQISWAVRDEFEVFEAADRTEALNQVRRHPVDLVLLDLRFPPYGTEITGGREILAGIRSVNPFVPVIIMTGDTDRDTAVEMLARGAFDLFRKPVNLEELLAVMRRALRVRGLEKEVRHLRHRLASTFGLDNLIGTSPVMQEVGRLVRKVADSNATVLITGESGTGKELVARSLHQLSSRREAPFVALNCSAVPETLIDDELFGHEKGAFTGAAQRRAGKFEYADRGTLFLDEVGDLPEPVQRKLLRVLQESEFERLGGNESIRVDVRLVAATHQDLEAKSREATFREDLYYRLKVVTLRLPALRDRVGDIPLLVGHFLRKHETKDSPKCVSPRVMEMLRDYSWPGNVRELENVIHGLCVTCEGPAVESGDLPEPLSAPRSGPAGGQAEFNPGTMSLPEVEREMIRIALRDTGGNRTRAAQRLGLTRHVLLNKIRKHRIDS
jgi:putative PEP-CTERM system response regulator